MIARILTYYSITESDLFFLYDLILPYLKSKGIEVLYKDLSNVIEGKDKVSLSLSIELHHETAYSNGVDVFLHDDLKEVGGISGRIYDLLHLGMGHAWQWGANENSGLKYHGDNAWEVGSQFYLFASLDQVKMVRDYEEEASMICLENLRIILEGTTKFSEELKKQITRFFNDYLNTDLKYIIDYYMTGEEKSFFSTWIYNTNSLPSMSLDFQFKPVKRDNVCTALISNRIIN